MTKSTILLTKEISEVVNERSRTWDEYDSVRKRVEEFNALSQKVTGTGPAENISPLTGQNTPPAEIIQTISELQKEFKNIDSAEAKIKMNHAEIERIKQRIMRIYISAGVTLVIIVVLIIMALSR